MSQIKALNEYFLMVVFMLLLKGVHVFANFMFNLNRQKLQEEGQGRIKAEISEDKTPTS